MSLILCVFTLAAPASAAGVDNHAPNLGPIYIGQIVPLTGVFAAPGFLNAGPGIFNRAGVRLAVRKINEHRGISGRPVRIILADDQSTVPGSIAAFRQLMRSVHHVTAIIGPGVGAEILAMTPFIERARIPMIIGSPIVTHIGNPWLFRTVPSNVYAFRALTSFAASTLHLARIALLHAEILAGTPNLLRADLKALGIQPLAEQTFTEKPADLTAQVLAIKKSGSSALLATAGYASDFILLANQMHQVGLHVTLVGNRALAGLETIRGAGSLIYGTYAVTDYASSQSPQATAFDRYSRSTMHLPGDFASAYTYDGMQILARVMRKVGTSPKAIRRGILAIRGYHGVMGTYNFDRNGDGLRQYSVVRNVKGHLRVIKVLSF